MDALALLLGEPWFLVVCFAALFLLVVLAVAILCGTSSKDRTLPAMLALGFTAAMIMLILVMNALFTASGNSKFGKAKRYGADAAATSVAAQTADHLELE